MLKALVMPRAFIPVAVVPVATVLTSIEPAMLAIVVGYFYMVILGVWFLDERRAINLRYERSMSEINAKYAERMAEIDAKYGRQLREIDAETGRPHRWN